MALKGTEATFEYPEIHGPGAWYQTSVIIASGQAAAMVAGEVIQLNTTNYKWETFVAAFPTGAGAILLEDVDATGGDDVKAVAMIVGSYRAEKLIWPAGITAEQKNIATAALRDRGLIPANNFPLYA